MKMGQRQREPELDSISQYPGQYSTPFNALKRRRYMELAPGQRGLYIDAFNVAGVDKQATIVDVGCGDGQDALELAMAGHRGRIIGVEVPYTTDETDSFKDRFLPVILEAEQRRLGNIEFRPGYAEAIPVETGEADVVVYGSVLQHPKDPDYVLKVETKRVLGRGGKVIIIHNLPDNKPLHHGYINKMGRHLGSTKIPKPLSSSFSINRATREARYHYRVQKEFVRRGDIPITIETLPDLLASVDTYQDLFWPPVSTQDWLRARQAVIEKPLTERLLTEGLVYDKAVRKVLVLEKKLTVLQIAHHLGFDAVSNGFKKQRVV